MTVWFFYSKSGMLFLTLMFLNMIRIKVCRNVKGGLLLLNGEDHHLEIGADRVQNRVIGKDQESKISA